MKTDSHKNLVGGAWIDASGGATFPNENPAQRGSMLGVFPASAREDMRAAIDAAEAAFPGWRETPLIERQRTMGRFLVYLEDSREELASIITRENGKTILESRAEVDSAVSEGTGNWHRASGVLGHTLPLGAKAMSGWVQYQSLGVVGIVTPWNFPVNTICRKTIPALLAGNTVVLKPASFTPWSGLFLAGLFQKAGFPAGTVNCVTGSGAAIGNALVEDARVRAVSFTGSTEVGKGIQEKAARNLTRTQLELGGKNALVVMPDADLEAVVSAVLTAGFACSGQWCTSTSRILVHESTRRKLVDSLAERCEGMKVGDPMEENTDMGPVAGHDQYRRIHEAISRAETEGARKVAGGSGGGEALKGGYFIRPTVFDEVSASMSIFREEIFGPVLAVTAFDTIDNAIHLANYSPYGLSSSIFTKDVEAAFAFVNRIEAGLTHVNIHTGFKDSSMPFGGWKESGFGFPENDVTGFEFFLNRKAVYVRV